MAVGAAHLPDAGVLLPPAVLQPPQQHLQQRPPSRIAGDAVHGRLVGGVNQLAVHVQLQLRGGGVADPDRQRAVEAGQPVELALVQPPLAGDAVHDLEVGGIARDRAQQPAAPLERLIEVAAGEHRAQRQRGVAQPAEAVVPVAPAADALGQRGGGCGHDPAGGAVGERLQHQQRAVDLVVVVARVAAVAGPLQPVGLAVVERRLRVDRIGERLVRREPGQHERDALGRA